MPLNPLSLIKDLNLRISPGFRRGISPKRFGWRVCAGAAAAVMLLIPATRAGEPASSESRFVIGLLLPPEEPQAESLRAGATLAVELANKSAGPPVSLVIRGRSGQWGADGVEAARMVTEDGATALIAPPNGAASHLVLQISGRTAVPVASLCPDSSVTTTGIPWMVRVVPRTSEEAGALFAQITCSHWAAVVPGGRAGREISKDLTSAASREGFVIEKFFEVNSSSTNFDALGAQIRTGPYDAILLWLEPAAAGSVARLLRSTGFQGHLAGPGSLCSPDFADAAGCAADSLFTAGRVLGPEATSAARTFAAVLKATLGSEPDPTAAAAYDAATILIQLFRSGAGSQPAHEAFPLNSKFIGALGTLAFDAQGNLQCVLQVQSAQNSPFVTRKEQ